MCVRVFIGISYDIYTSSYSFLPFYLLAFF